DRAAPRSPGSPSGSPLRSARSTSNEPSASWATDPSGRVKRACGRCGRAHQADEEQAEAADGDLVAVVQLRQLHALAVPEHAVQAAVVQEAGAGLVPVDQRVAARHGRVVEADVRREASPDPRPPVLQREHAYSLVVLQGPGVAL